MAFVDLGSIHFYQPPSTAGPPGEGRSVGSNLCVPTVSNELENHMAFGPRSDSSGRVEDVIEYLDLTTSLWEEPFYPSCEPALDPIDAESHALGTPYPLQL